MKYLLVGKNGVLDTMIIAMGFMGLNDIKSCREFANLEMENTGRTIKMGTDAKDNDVYVVGNKFPDIVEIANNELKKLSHDTDTNKQLTLIKVSAEGETMTSYLVMLAKIPLIGKWFAGWAKYSTLQRKDKLIQQGQNLRLKQQVGLEPVRDEIIAAKPY